MKHLTVAMTPPWRVKTLPGLFRERVRASAAETAYLAHDSATRRWRGISWQEVAQRATRWQRGFQNEGLADGARVALQMANSVEWVAVDQAALGLGLVVVPLYANDRAENIAHILHDSGASLLVLQKRETWLALLPHAGELPALRRVVCLEECPDGAAAEGRMHPLRHWLPESEGNMLYWDGDPNRLATIVYTSGTTGRPKGVMLSHRNILADVYNSLRLVPAYKEDLFLSFLPLSHTLERTAGYYLPMMAGSTVAHARSVQHLAEDLVTVRPTVLISVPRIYERIHSEVMRKLEKVPEVMQRLFALTLRVGWNRFLHQRQKSGWEAALLIWPLLDRLMARKVRQRLGGRLRISICGGAPLAEEIARFFIALGIPMVQGYGMTETAPVISVNTVEGNDPTSVGPPLPEVETRIAPNGELMVKGPVVMLGYWNNPEATRQSIDPEGWLHTGDMARLEEGRLYITGRIKEIIVLSNGRKIAPFDVESAILMEPLFAQALVVGERRPYLTALVVLEPRPWRELAAAMRLDPDAPASLRDPWLHQRILEMIGKRLHTFPGFAKVQRVHLTLEPWSVENGLITPTLKLRRSRVLQHYTKEIDALYAGHDLCCPPRPEPVAQGE